jgi:hypothetical protein
MKLNRLSQLTAVALLTVTGFSIQAAEVWSESFETDGQGIRYSSSAEFNDGLHDHWGRTDGSNISNTSGAYTNMDGTWFWAAEDTDDNGGDGNQEQILTISGIDISTYINLQFTGLFAAGNENGPGAGAYDAADYIKVQYQVDGGGYIDGMCFSYENIGDIYNEPIGLDADCDGFSDGVVGRLNTVLTSYGFTIPETGASLDLLISVYMDGAGEEVAFDHLVLTGDGGGGGDVAPTVSSSVPTNGAVGVTENTTVTINFSEDIDATASAVTMSCSTSGAVSFSSGLPATAVSQLVLTPSTE